MNLTSSKLVVNCYHVSSNRGKLKGFKINIYVLPWQMNNTFIIVIERLKLPGNILFLRCIPGLWSNYCSVLPNCQNLQEPEILFLKIKIQSVP